MLALVAAGGYYAWKRNQAVPAPEAAPVAAAPAAPAEPAPPPAPAASPAAPAVEHPIEAAEPGAEGQADKEPLPALADAGPQVNQMLERLIGRKNVLNFLQIDGFLSPDLRHNAGEGALADTPLVGPMAQEVLDWFTAAAAGQKNSRTNGQCTHGKNFSHLIEHLRLLLFMNLIRNDCLERSLCLSYQKLSPGLLPLC